MTSHTTGYEGKAQRWLKIAEVLRDRPEQTGVAGLLEQIDATGACPVKYMLVVTPLDTQSQRPGQLAFGECWDDLLWEGVELAITWGCMSCVSVHDLDDDATDFWAGCLGYLAIDEQGLFTTFPADDAAASDDE
jgi:hypothetical protein